jgi:hypothetical protein
MAAEQGNMSESAFGGASLVELIAAILQWAGGPVELDDLVDVVADRLGIHDETVRYEDEQSESVESAPVNQAFLDTELDQRAYLARLWMEIQQLPLRQRAALLLNLKDASGGDCTRLFPLRGIATIRQIAEALDMLPERFAELWKDLPLEDAAIAELLGVRRQQVINLRKCARERLARRMRAFEERRGENSSPAVR